MERIQRLVQGNWANTQTAASRIFTFPGCSKLRGVIYSLCICIRDWVSYSFLSSQYGDPNTSMLQIHRLSPLSRDGTLSAGAVDVQNKLASNLSSSSRSHRSWPAMFMTSCPLWGSSTTSSNRCRSMFIQWTGACEEESRRSRSWTGYGKPKVGKHPWNMATSLTTGAPNATATNAKTNTEGNDNCILYPNLFKPVKAL